LGDKKETVRFWITAGALAEEERYDGAFPGWKTELDEFPFASSDSTALKAIQDFFSPEKNAIIQSFESAGGRGLAGFITSFDMDWNDQIWEVDGVGNRAPKSLKISIAFSPVHDIVPGLDHHGFTRAVNYPVGKTSATFGQDQHGEGYAGQSNAEAGEEIPGTIPNAQYFYTDAAAKLIHPDTLPKPPKDGKKG